MNLSSRCGFVENTEKKCFMYIIKSIHSHFHSQTHSMNGNEVTFFGFNHH